MGGMSTRTMSIVLSFALFLVAVAAGAQTAPYTRTEIVNATGNPTNDGTALLNAVASLSPTPSATNRWLIKLEPGTYDLGTDDLVVPQYVDIEGSGIEATTIQGNYDPFANSSTPLVNGMVKGADNSEIRELTVHCISTSGSEQGACMAMSNESVSPRITRVRFLSDGSGTGTHWGVRNYDSAPTFEDVEVKLTSSDSANNYGITFSVDSTMLIYNTEIDVRNASSYNVGLFSREDMGRSEFFNSRVKGLSGSFAYGIYFSSNSAFTNDLKIDDSVVIAAAGSSDTAGIKIEGSGGLLGSGTFNIRDSRVYGNPDAINDVTDTASFFIINSELTGSGILVNADQVKIGTTQLINGGSITGFSSKVCAGVYDGSYTFYASTCP